MVKHTIILRYDTVKALFTSKKTDIDCKKIDICRQKTDMRKFFLTLPSILCGILLRKYWLYSS
jgi:hypothetical protein